jgi:hypothetical protein
MFYIIREYMPEETKPAIEPQEQQTEIKSLNANEIISRLEDKRDGKYRFSDQVQIDCIFGMDPKRVMSVSGWSCFLKTQSLPKGLVIDTDQGEISGSIVEQIPISYVKEIRVDNKVYTVDRDAWGNPSTYVKSENKSQEPKGEFQETLKKATSLWEAATLGEDELRETIANLFGEEVLIIVVNILSQLEEYPEIQANKYWARKIDLWDIAYKGKTVDDAKKILRGVGGGVRLPYGLDNTPMFHKCEEIIEKIINHQALTDQDRFFIDAIKVSKFAISKSIRSLDTYSINDFSRRYAMANLVENLLCRELVGWDIYEQHHADFDDFSSNLEKSGYKVPEWFQPYEGNEFVWSFALDGTIANAGGKYFLDSISNPEDITHVLDHERCHRLRTIASDLGQNTRWEAEKEGTKFEFEKYDESFTESLALLIRNGGNVEHAIAENNEQTMSYKNGVDRLLRILLAINNHSGDLLLASKLMIDGLKGISGGSSLSQTDAVRAYYDSQIAEEGAFDALMSDFADQDIIRVKWGANEDEKSKPDISILKETIRSSMADIKYDDLNEQEKQKYRGGSEKFEEYKERELGYLEKWPISIIDDSPSPLVRKILNQVVDSPDASIQLQAMLNYDYEQYATALRSWLETGKKKRIR